MEQISSLETTKLIADWRNANIVIITVNSMRYTEKSQQKFLEEILAKNEQFCPRSKYRQGGLFIHGELCSTIHTPSSSALPFGILDSSLDKEGTRYLLLRDKMYKDEKVLRQNLSVLLKGCTSYQDIRDTLPNITQSVNSALKDYSRTREEAYAFQDNPIRMRQYKQVEDILYYNIGNEVFS